MGAIKETRGAATTTRRKAPAAAAASGAAVQPAPRRKAAKIPASDPAPRHVVVMRVAGKRSGAVDKAVLRYIDIYKAPPQDRVEVIRRGIPATAVGDLSSALEVSTDSLSEALGIARATLSRKAREGKVLATDESERVLGMQALIGQVQAMIEQSGDPAALADFDAAKWVANWLNKPLRALGGVTPASYLDTVEGQKLVSNLLAMAQSGAYA